jgi:hypothetical protein
MPGIRGLYKAQFGKETTLGTETDATTIWRGKANIAPESAIVYAEEDVAIIGGVGRSYIPYETATVAVESEVTPEQLPYLLNMGVRGVAGSRDGTGSGYVYTYDLPETTVYSPYTYTWEVGDNQEQDLVSGCFAEQITITGAATEAWKMSATLRGWPLGSGAFTGTLSIPEVEEIVFGKSKLFIDTSGGAFGGTPITTSFISFELTINNIYKAQPTGEGTNKYYTFIKMSSMPEITLNFTLEHDTFGVAEREARRNRTERLVRIEGIGSALTTSSTYTTKEVILDLAGTYMEPEPLDEDDGNMIVPLVLKNHYVGTATDRGKIIVVNQLSALP